MGIDAEAKKIKKWADTGDRTDPDDSSLTPTLSRATGWPSSFSASAGDTPRRRVMNQVLRELTGLGVEVMSRGVLEWDADIDYAQYAVVQQTGTLRRATVATGPGTSNATDPDAAGQVIWEGISGETSNPSAPAAPQATAPRSGELDWFWNCPLDGGAQITEFDFQWREAGTQAWSDSVVVNTARAVLTGLTNGQAIQTRVRARTAQGESLWSPLGSATPSGTVPGGGATLALRAASGEDGEVPLDWLEPDDGGVSITSYTIQWRTANQAYSSSRQATATTLMHTVGSLANDVERFFRVRAVNGEGNGTWSNEAVGNPPGA